LLFLAGVDSHGFGFYVARLLDINLPTANLTDITPKTQKPSDRTPETVNAKYGRDYRGVSGVTVRRG